MTSGQQPWSSLPPQLAEVLRPVLPSLSDQIIAAIRSEVEDYAGPLDGPFGRAVRSGTELALNRFLDLIAEPNSADDQRRRMYVELGRGEFNQGRSLNALLAAYRIGAGLAWRRFVEAGTRAGMAPEVLYRLGEAIFAYIDSLSAESIEGYAQAQSAAAGERQRRCQRVIRLLQQDPPADQHAIAAAAAEAGWTLPGSLAALVASVDDATGLAAALGADAIATRSDDVTLVIIADPAAPGRRSQIERACAGAPAALGSRVPWWQAPVSIERARIAHRLVREGALGGPFVVADEHLPALLVHGRPGLAEDLVALALRPLAEEPPARREKLYETLRVWLDHRGRLEEAAAVLGVHAQTVRYRLNRLRELFGPRLEDPEERFALSLALRAAERTGRRRL